MTYAQFLLLFVVPPIVLLGAHLALRRRLSRRLALALGVTAVLAVVYTGPWDSTIISQGVWAYPPGRVLGPTVALVPLEEYTFFVLQVLMTGLLTASLLGRRDPAVTPAQREE
ncbi:MAG TPA: lycopene cyclase domain-containing protein [Solirubrobacterales bacterium]